MKDLYDLSDEELEAEFLKAKEDRDTNAESMEQPATQESDDDASLEEVKEEVIEEESEEEEALGEEADETKDQPEAKATTEVEIKQPVQNKNKYRANGQEYEFTDDEIKQQFGKVFGQAMDYTKKTQALKERRKTLDILDQTGIKDEDLSLMADVLKGNKDAIATMLKRTGVDAFDLDLENANYVAKDYGRSDTELAIKEVVDRIADDPVYPTTYNILEKQWDDKSRESFVKDPKLITQLHEDVRTGEFFEVNAVAQKMKLFDDAKLSDLEYYMHAARQKYTAIAQNAQQVAQTTSKIAQVKATQAKQVQTKSVADKRKSAAPSNKRVGSPKRDYLDDSDEGFEDWYSKLQASV